MARGRVIVLGSINLDIQLRVAEFPRPGETVASTGVREGLGGKGANQAVAASRAGADAALIGKVGQDGAARDLLARAAPALAIDDVAIEPDCVSGAAYILVSQGGENEIVVVAGANEHVADHGDVAIASGDICLAQLEIPVAAVERFFRAARTAGARTVLNTAPAILAARPLFALSDVIVMNETELAHFSDRENLASAGIDSLAAMARELMSRPDQALVVTLGAVGALTISATGETHVAGRRASPVDTTGAGDCFCGVLCAALAEGLDLAVAVERANVAASLQVERHGAAEAMPDAKEIAAAVT